MLLQSCKLPHFKANEAIGIEIIPWRPLGRKFGSLHREMDDLWRRFFGKTPLARRAGEEWWPTVDASETKDNFIIKAELPGVEEKARKRGSVRRCSRNQGREEKGGRGKGRAPLSC